MHADPIDPGQRLRIAVLGDFDGVHTRAWLPWFVARGHDVHAISYYPPRRPIEGVTVHVLRARSWEGAASGATRPVGLPLPRAVMRLGHALRYRAAGLRRVVRTIAPDVLHAHFVVEHGFYGLGARFHPYVITAWGSDVLVEPRRDPLARAIAKWTLGRADLVTSNNRFMAEVIVSLGAPPSRVEVVTLGADRFFLERSSDSVNVRGEVTAASIISTRAHEPLYNIGEIIDAYARVVVARPHARLAIAHAGAQTPELRRRARRVGGDIEFLDFLDRHAFREALAAAHVFVSVPSSDGTSVALLQAMAAGCFPVVSDLPTQRELIDDGLNGFRVPLHRPDVLADRMMRALDDGDLRREAVALNRRIVEERGLNENEMAKLERLYLRLCGRG